MEFGVLIGLADPGLELGINIKKRSDSNVIDIGWSARDRLYHSENA